MPKHSRTHKRGVTLIEVMISLVASLILLMGMGTVLILLFTGMRESKDFSEATTRIDLIRQLTFDARTGEEIVFPTVDGPGDYTTGTTEGDQIQFDALFYTPLPAPGVTTSARVTWESVRPTSSAPTDPYTVNRWVNTGSGNELRFAQNNITEFEIERVSDRNFTVDMETTENAEVVSVELSVTLRNVTD